MPLRFTVRVCCAVASLIKLSKTSQNSTMPDKMQNIALLHGGVVHWSGEGASLLGLSPLGVWQNSQFRTVADVI